MDRLKDITRVTQDSDISARFEYIVGLIHRAWSLGLP